MTTTATEAIGALLQELTEAWNDGDAERYAAAFTEDADYITFFGLRMRGRKAIEDGHRHLFRLPIKLDPASGTEADVKVLGDGVALVISGGTSTVDGEADPTRNSVISLTAVLTEVGWRFASFQNTRVSDPKAAR
ncbi:SgcJ/EcaC family oxidoreductase [Acrocarpospora catenulata]|uniref:SgcJ/EcaC family oxidoreductase n=1 Tax=Acrocarpospora catenulata TaxID=2836182 RepID=UPI001BDA368C|nr:SgcJ/EcaC family oxidoreductase [Acrocarpospora catenulata]